MMRRLLLATLVLGATIYWANCSYNPPRVPADPDWNSFFASCYSGPITDPAAGGDLTLVLEDPGGDDKLTLTGCLQIRRGAMLTLATLAGSVQAVREEAIATAMPTNGRPSFDVKVVRDPAGEAVATTVDVSDQQGAPFVSANDLPRCVPELDCAALGITQPFMPGGGMP